MSVQAFAEEQLRKAVRRNQAAMPAAASGRGTPGLPADGGGKGPAGALTRSRLDAINAAGASALAALRDGVARMAASHKSAKVWW
jgi:hypothetical protein